MARYPTAERTAHVLRRLSLGGHPALIDRLTPETAIARALDVSDTERVLPELEIPQSLDAARSPELIVDPISWWIESAMTPTRLIEERLAWFWHDVFATSIRKVPVPYLLWQQHLTIRSHATGSFAELLAAIARDPAMLVYLDGIHNTADAPNENFAREVMELHTMGPGNYDQVDVVDAARAFSGWIVRVPGTRFGGRGEPWSAEFVEQRHDGGIKTILGTEAAHDMDSAVAVLLDQPATKRYISARLFHALVGLDAPAATVDRLAAAFDDYSIMALVEAIVSEPTFLSDDAIRSIVRNPFERMITVAQAFRLARPVRFVAPLLVNQQFFPFGPPNPAGYPSGTELLGPHAMVHGFDLAAAVHPDELDRPDDYLSRLGIRHVTDASAAALADAPTAGIRLALAINTPEMYLT